jgi:ATP-dependent DNA ligase
MELAIIGFVPAKGRPIAALRLARREGKELVYAGKVGTGFTQKTAQSVRERLGPLLRKTPALAKPLRKKDTVWVEPRVSARVQLLELTEDGQVRAGSFKGWYRDPKITSSHMVSPGGGLRLGELEAGFSSAHRPAYPALKEGGDRPDRKAAGAASE